MPKYVSVDDLDTYMRRGSRDGNLDINTLHRFPAADVAPVVHARWIPDSPFTGKCSRCHSDGNLKQGFCGNCGASMDIKEAAGFHSDC